METDMSDEKTTTAQKNKARRNLLKGIVAGGGALTAGKTLPENWAKPVVESVTLPAHAQTTTDAGSESLQDLSPFQSGDQPFVHNDLDNSEERFAALDAPCGNRGLGQVVRFRNTRFFRASRARRDCAYPTRRAPSRCLPRWTGTPEACACLAMSMTRVNFEAFLTNTPVQRQHDQRWPIAT
jgi:hypothetical protein